MPRATLQTRLAEKLAAKGFEVLLQQELEEGAVVQHGDLVATPDWSPQPSLTEQQHLAQLVDLLQRDGFQVKSNKEIFLQLGLDIDDSESYLSYLALEGSLVRLNQESSLHSDYYHQARRLLVDLLQQQDAFTLAEFRDKLGSNRKLTQALLEFFDSCKYTRRTGEQRVAWQLPEID